MNTLLDNTDEMSFLASVKNELSTLGGIIVLDKSEAIEFKVIDKRINSNMIFIVNVTELLNLFKVRKQKNEAKASLSR